MTVGMDHCHYRYDPDSSRPQITWPNDARIAFWVILHFEFHELHPPDAAISDPRYRGDFGNYSPDYRAHSLREYGNRVGIARILKVLEKHRIVATVAANTMAIAERSSVAISCHEAGHEICAHGVSSSRLVSSRLTTAEEQQLINGTRDAVLSVTERTPRGWISQDFGESIHTPTLLSSAGFNWVGDWPNDDSPYLMTTHPPMVSIPYQNEWDDANVIEVHKMPAWKWRQIAITAFDELHAEGGRVFGLGMHPWVIGHPHCISYLDDVLAHIMAKNDVWQATGTQIAEAMSRG